MFTMITMSTVMIISTMVTMLTMMIMLTMITVMTMIAMITMMTMMIKVKGANEIGKCNLFPMVTSNIRVVRARTLHRETMLHITFLKVNFVIIILKRDHTISKMIVMLFTTTYMHIQELIHKLTTGQIRLRVLDLRGLEVVVTPQFFFAK